MSGTIKTQNWGNIELITTDSYTGEGTEDLILEIDSKYCSAWIHLTDDEVRKLRDELNVKFITVSHNVPSLGAVPSYEN